jgi:hypothetical protein
MTDTFWNGEPCEARIVKVIVGKPLRPSWWCADLEGKQRTAIQIAQQGQTFFIDHEDGTGWRKITEGRGMPNYPHSSLPSDSQLIGIVVPTHKKGRTLTWWVDSPDAGHPECLCSWCANVISDEDVPPIRLFDDESGMEARFHIDCWNDAQTAESELAEE